MGYVQPPASGVTLPETNILVQKIDGWKTFAFPKLLGWFFLFLLFFRMEKLRWLQNPWPKNDEEKELQEWLEQGSAPHPVVWPGAGLVGGNGWGGVGKRWVEDSCWPAFICLSYKYVGVICCVYMFFIMYILYVIHVLQLCAAPFIIHFCLQPKKSLTDVDSLPGLQFSSTM